MLGVMLGIDERIGMTSLQLEAAPPFGVVQSRASFPSDLARTGRFVAGQRGLNKKCGVQALHDHFDVLDDEAIIQFLDAETLRTEVVSRDEVAGKLPVAWVVTLGGILVPTQWNQEGAVGTDLDPDLVRFGQFLAEEGLTGTFSLVRLPLSLDAGPGNVLFEKTNFSARTQVNDIVSFDTVPSCDYATWAFGDDDDGTPFVVACCQCLGCPYKKK
jgi:hypothetical protein